MSCFTCLGPRLKEANKVEGSARVHSNSAGIVDVSMLSGLIPHSGWICREWEGKDGIFRQWREERRVEGNSAARSFTFRELATATRNFRPTDMIGPPRLPLLGCALGSKPIAAATSTAIQRPIHHHPLPSLLLAASASLVAVAIAIAVTIAGAHCWAPLGARPTLLRLALLGAKSGLALAQA
ncbi:hypothetical protein ACLOJK_018479 [Asimina triloba]